MADTVDPSLERIRTADLTGTELGSYQILRRLGQGAMAEVYLAQQESLKRQVALKILHSNLATDETYVRRFHQEAQAAAQLVHGAIVQIYEVGSAGRLHFIAQEYVRGMSLGQLLSRQGPPNLPNAVSIMRQVASGLAKAGQAGIIHRDIKPENIMLSTTGEVKVADFGLARVTSEAALNLTQEGITLGTPLYMSPEQVEGKPLDARSDIYSFGVTCYHMLSGSPPFRGESALAVAVQHLRTAPQRLENLRPDLPPALCRIVHKMLAKSPEHRHQTAREILDELRALGIEGAAEHDYVEPSDELNTPDRHGVTQRLSAVMKASSAAAAGLRRWKRPAVAGALAFCAGLGLAWVSRPAPLLPTVAKLPNVDLKPTAEAQFDYAQRIDTQAGWQSVFQFYPEDRELALEAKQQLARWYIDQNQFADAQKIFNELAGLGDDDKRWRALGLLGQALMHSVEKKPLLVREKLAELRPLRLELPVREARQLVTQVIDRQGRNIPEEIRSQWQAWRSAARSREPRNERRRDERTRREIGS